MKTTRTIAALATIALLGLSACSNSETASDTKVDTATSVESTSPSAESSSEAKDEHKHSHAPVTMTDGYVKAKGADKKMTAIFGTLVNESDTPQHVTGFSTNLGDYSYEIHEVVDGKMQQKADGIVIPANGTYVLGPGHDHLMIMGISEEVPAGSNVDLTLNFEDGSHAHIDNLPVRTLGAGEESYGDQADHEGHEGHGDHAEHAGHNH